MNLHPRTSKPSTQFNSHSRNMISGLGLLMLLFVFSLALFGKSNTYARELPHHEVTANVDDYSLREALLTGNLEKFDYYLSVGANPMEWLDDSQFGWVFCAATEAGSEKFLLSLIDKGYDVNYRQVDISSSISLPLACAVRFDNLRALELLVAAGADPTVAPSIKFPSRVPMSVMSLATIVGKYDLAVWLFDQSDYTDEQLRSDIGMLESFPVDESAPGNIHRLMLVDLFRKKGYEVTPWTKKKASEK